MYSELYTAGWAVVQQVVLGSWTESETINWRFWNTAIHRKYGNQSNLGMRLCWSGNLGMRLCWSGNLGKRLCWSETWE